MSLIEKDTYGHYFIENETLGHSFLEKLNSDLIINKIMRMI